MQITLNEILSAREERAQIQNELLDRYAATLVCFTMNIAGPVKTSPVIERAFSEGVNLIKEALADCTPLFTREDHGRCGPVLYYSVSADAELVKSLLTEIEDNHPIGRLFDMDVIDTDGRRLSRKSERGCMVCGAPGRACGAGRLHPIEELVLRTNTMLSNHFLDTDARRIAKIAKRSLIDEVYTTPKPGLVDRENCGSHTDMGICEFKRSADALEPYFIDCVKIGWRGKADDPQKLFMRLRERGISAECEMYRATGGVNTHKGIIFSMGILACAAGRLITPSGDIPTAELILKEAAFISAATVSADLASINASTAGGRAYVELGHRGIRGEVLDGFPSVRDIALPIYRKYLSEGKNKNDAGAFTLLHLIANIYDTCIFKRGGNEAVAYAKERAQALLASGEPALAEIRALNGDFTERNLSPGGSADLLAITYFLSELEDERDQS